MEREKIEQLKPIEQTTVRSVAGLPWLLVAVLAVIAAAVVFILAIANENFWLLGAAGVLGLTALVLGLSFYMVRPNETAVMTLFGDYKGNDSVAGLRVANPLLGKKRVSLRVRNFTTSTSKVNDARGNPIEIAAVVVWRVVDSARAMFGVDDFLKYVEVQSESAVRHLARSYPYDAFDESDVITLIGDTGEINANLATELQERANDAGIEIIETRITDLAYAPEIAEAMLRRQQASAIVAARQQIVEGAVLMVRDAVKGLAETDDSDDDPIYLDADRRATFASNLMTVIASDSPTSPVVNVGTLHR